MALICADSHRAIRLLFVFALSIAVQTCASSKKFFTNPVMVESSEEPTKLTLGLSKSEVVESELATSSSFFGINQKVVEDIPHISRAMEAEKNLDFISAVKHWREAMRLARGNMLGERVFRSYVTALLKSSKQSNQSNQLNQVRQTKESLATFVMDQSSGMNVSPWAIRTGLNQVAPLAGYLEKHFSSYLDEVDGDLVAAPDRAGIPAGDPLLLKISRKVCMSKSGLSIEWNSWRMTLTSDLVTYFDALVFQCQGKVSDAVKMFSDVAPRLASDQKFVSFGIESYQRLIKMRRDGGERESVAPLYLPLLRAWSSPNINESLLGLSTQAFELRRLDDFLAAARAQASISAYDKVQEIVTDIIRLVDACTGQIWTFQTDAKLKLSSVKAEAYHLLANRNGVELKNWQLALDAIEKGLQVPDLSDEWRSRFTFNKGMTLYLMNRFDEAKKIWSSDLTDRLDDSNRPMLLYWTSVSLAKEGLTGEAQFYQKMLIQDHPLSFYSLQVNGVKHLPIQKMKIQSLEVAKRTFDYLKEDQVALLERAEVLTAAGISEFASQSLEELQRLLSVSALSQRDVEFGNYLVQLYALNGDWFQVISLLTKLSKYSGYWDLYPEMLALYFPRPYFQDFVSISSKGSVEPSTAFAISRQESSFRADAKSPAFAYGLMQLTMPTAKRIQDQHSVQLQNGLSVPSLLEPATNIQFGVHNLGSLSRIYGGELPMIFAAYNAGETPTNNWQKARNFNDPLLFAELIPYSETKSYVKNVWRNKLVYEAVLAD